MPTVLKVNNAADLVVATACALGFWPTDSFGVVLTWADPDAEGPRAVRADLADLDNLVEILTNLIATYGPARVAVTTFGDRDNAERAAAALSAATPVQMMARTDGTTAWCLCDVHECPHPPMPVPVDSHPFVAEMVAVGRVPQAAAQIIAEVTPASNTVSGVVSAEQIKAHQAAAQQDPRGWTERTIGLWEAAEADQVASAEDVAHLIAATQIVGVRDLLWSHISTENAARAHEVWAWIVTRSPAEYAVGALSLAGFAAWLSGNGYRARLTLEQAQRLDPGYTMAALVTQALEARMNPKTWTGFEPGQMWENLERTLFTAA